MEDYRFPLFLIIALIVLLILLNFNFLSSFASLQGQITVKGEEPVCGDGICEPPENCHNCPKDCGVCPPKCGNGKIDPGENCYNCPEDVGYCMWVFPVPKKEAEDMVLGILLPKQTVAIPDMGEGESASFQFPGLGSIVRVTAKANKYIHNPWVSIEEYAYYSSIAEGKLSGNMIHKKIHRYIEILSNMQEEDIEEVTILFRVPKTWLLGENVNPEAVVLAKHADSVWVELPTEQAGVIGDDYFYKVVVKGFSIHAITITDKAGMLVEMCPGVTCPEGYRLDEDCECIPTLCAIECLPGQVIDYETCKCITPPREILSYFTEFTVLIVIIIVLAGYFLMRRW